VDGSVLEQFERDLDLDQRVVPAPVTVVDVGGLRSDGQQPCGAGPLGQHERLAQGLLRLGRPRTIRRVILLLYSSSRRSAPSRKSPTAMSARSKWASAALVDASVKARTCRPNATANRSPIRSPSATACSAMETAGSERWRVSRTSNASSARRRAAQGTMAGQRRSASSATSTPSALRPAAASAKANAHAV